MSVRKKMVVAAIALVAAVGYLAIAGAQKGWVYLLEVDQFVADSSFHAQRVRLHGAVADDETFDARPGQLTAHFTLVGQTQTLHISYTGTIPDLFKQGANVVVEGRMDEQRQVFQADVLMTKCASKYEAESPHESDPQRGGPQLPGDVPRDLTPNLTNDNAVTATDKEQRS